LVQAEGVFPDEHRVALGNRLYGCDDCQEVCPPSRRADPTTTANTPTPTIESEAWVDVVEVLAADDDALLDRFGRWYIPKREPRYLRRNALVVLGNTASATNPDVRDALTRALGCGDALVAAHAVWAARRLDADDLVATALADGGLDGTDPMERAELDRAIAARGGS